MSLASVSTTKSRLKSGMANTGAVDIARFNYANAVFCRASQVNGTPFPVKSLRGAANCAKWGMNRL